MRNGQLDEPVDASSAYAVYAKEQGWLDRKGGLGPGRVVGVGEHIVRIFGFKRSESLYGIEGDRLAQKYDRRGWDWVGDVAEECQPAFLSLSQDNELIAYMIVCAIPFVISIVILYFISPRHDTPPRAFVPLTSSSASNQLQPINRTEPNSFQSPEQAAAPVVTNATLQPVNTQSYIITPAYQSVSGAPPGMGTAPGTSSALRYRMVVNR